MIELIKLPFRILAMPIVLLLLALTAGIELLYRTPDWQYWRDFNREIIELLPFKIDA